MELTLSTPALLFPAASLLLLVYANRFLNIARLIRELHAEYRHRQEPALVGQITLLRRRLLLLRSMQLMTVASLAACVLCMMGLFAGREFFARAAFITALWLFLGSLLLFLWEAHLSIRALDLHLRDQPAQRLEPRGPLRRPRRWVRGDLGFQRLQFLPVLLLLSFEAFDAA